MSADTRDVRWLSPHARRVMFAGSLVRWFVGSLVRWFGGSCPRFSVADRCLQSDAVPGSRLQVPDLPVYDEAVDDGAIPATYDQVDADHFRTQACMHAGHRLDPPCSFFPLLAFTSAVAIVTVCCDCVL